MQQFVRGQRAKISSFSSATKFEVSITLTSTRVAVFDFVCFGVDANAQLSDDRYMVFFNQQIAPDDAIQLLELRDQSARFSVDASKVPPSISRLVFTASVDGAGTMRDLETGVVTLQEAVVANTPLLEYGFKGSDFAEEGALMLAEIYRKDGEWRFWAQGQGFAGDLSALLKHFGGQEVEDTTAPTPAPAPTPQQSHVQPPPPTSHPAALSSPASRPVPSVPVVAGPLQEKIAQTPEGGILSLSPGEYQGPIILNRSISLDGRGAVRWAHNGPVLIVNSTVVSLLNLDIEATSPDQSIPGSNVALRVVSGDSPRIENIKTRGEVEGIAQVEGVWKLPQSLDLGEFAPRALNSFRLHIEVPHECELKTPVAGVSFHPQRLQSGPNEIEIRVENVGNDTFLVGMVEFQSSGIARTVPISGRSARNAVEAVCGRVLNAN